MYAYTLTYSYNELGANEHLNVNLYKLDGYTYYCFKTWSYSTFMKERLSNALAERRILRLKKVYDAQPL